MKTSQLQPVARLAWPAHAGRFMEVFIMFAVDNTAHQDSQQFNELVPSRYALQVGEIDVLVVSDGVLPLPTATMATNVDPVDLSAWLDRMYMPQDAFDWPLNVMVARSGEQIILVDAGLGGQL